MPYVSTELNRLYAALESSYGVTPAPAPSNAFRFLKSSINLVQDYLQRQDKTGSRSYAGVAPGGRRHGKFDVESYLIPSGTAGTAPNMGPFFQAACGGTPEAFAGGTAIAGCTTSSILFSANHNLSVGQAIGIGNEIRFVITVNSSTAITVDPPFSSAPTAATAITATVTYPLADAPPTLSLFDYWSPSTAQQRILCGAAVDEMEVSVSGDFHQVTFSGVGQDVIDSGTFASGQGGLTSFPAEPTSQTNNGNPLAGCLGQIWLGSPATGFTTAKFATLSTAKLQLQNQFQLRGNEFGNCLPQTAVAGQRKVTFDFDVFELDDTATAALYNAARGRTPATAFLQLGTIAGSMFGVYMSALTPQVPTDDSSQKQLVWKFTGSRAGDGTPNAEIFVAFA
jgi:hypothetical protein